MPHLQVGHWHQLHTCMKSFQELCSAIYAGAHWNLQQSSCKMLTRYEHCHWCRKCKSGKSISTTYAGSHLRKHAVGKGPLESCSHKQSLKAACSMHSPRKPQWQGKEPALHTQSSWHASLDSEHLNLHDWRAGRLQGNIPATDAPEMCNGCALPPAVKSCRICCWISANVLLVLLVCASTRPFFLHIWTCYISVSINQLQSGTQSKYEDWPVDDNASRLQVQSSKVKGAINFRYVRICLLIYEDFIHDVCTCASTIANYDLQYSVRRIIDIAIAASMRFVHVWRDVWKDGTKFGSHRLLSDNKWWHSSVKLRAKSCQRQNVQSMPHDELQTSQYWIKSSTRY